MYSDPRSTPSGQCDGRSLEATEDNYTDIPGIDPILDAEIQPRPLIDLSTHDNPPTARKEVPSITPSKASFVQSLSIFAKEKKEISEKMLARLDSDYELRDKGHKLQEKLINAQIDHLKGQSNDQVKRLETQVQELSAAVTESKAVSNALLAKLDILIARGNKEP